MKRGRLRAFVLQHVPFEPLGSIEPWLLRAGAEVRTVHLYNHDRLPDVEDVDLLIAMGGPMSVNDEHEHPWLVHEKRLIRDVIDAGKAMVGVCLGSQLIASALGAPVYRNPYKEIGWFPIRRVRPGTAASSDPRFEFPEDLTVFHWHGETFDPPAGAAVLAESEATPCQAFQFGPHVIGLQCHLETTPATAQDIVTHCADELVEGRFIQSATAILAARPIDYQRINALMDDVLSFVTRSVDDER
jgi:GMP synthase-like glutamine amidotransferase